MRHHVCIVHKITLFTSCGAIFQPQPGSGSPSGPIGHGASSPGTPCNAQQQLYYCRLCVDTLSKLATDEILPTVIMVRYSYDDASATAAAAAADATGK